jgi:1-acyl-sn-glycerol-3-phosphate acyltransferase
MSESNSSSPPSLGSPLESLTPLERAAYRAADFLARQSDKNVVTALNNVFMGSLIWSCGGNRFRIRGLEHLQRFGPQDSVLFVANHRSFFDFFTVNAIVVWHTDLGPRTLFPVRGTFFYDHPIGPFVNLVMSGMRMFPPILRDPKRTAFNKFSVQRAVDELHRPGTVMGLHPEGTRNKGADPYQFLAAQPGVGKIALEGNVPTFPVYLKGMSNDLPGELKRNWFQAKSTPIDVVFGPEIDFSDLRKQQGRVAIHKRASDRCLDAIRACAETVRAREEREGRAA